MSPRRTPADDQDVARYGQRFSRFKDALPTVEQAPPPRVAKVRRTYYIRKDLADRLAQEQRRLNWEIGGVSLSQLHDALLEAGFEQLAEIVPRLKAEAVEAPEAT